MPPPRISVVLPVHDAEAYLETALRSVLTQSFTDFEVIAIDDGSSDQSPAILSRIAREDGRVQIVTQANAGVTAALNRGISEARGEFIARMDADDICEPDRFENQIRFLEANPDVVAVGGQVLLIDQQGRPLRDMPVPLQHAEIDGTHLLGEHALVHPAVVLRADILRQVGVYREDFISAQDADLWLRLAEVGKLANLPERVLRYRQHPKSVGYRQRSLQRLTAWRVAREAAQRRGLGFDRPEPTTEPAAPLAATYAKWAWWALGAGNVAVARHYAYLAFRAEPRSKASWRLAYCALRGR